SCSSIVLFSVFRFRPGNGTPHHHAARFRLGLRQKSPHSREGGAAKSNWEMFSKTPFAFDQARAG
ncbi:hypothetical protein, partial [Escherichia coli]|uniref:hypothetical protein n=1 Tax=Escherichia coli TaxID=562 RepID=UPI0028DE9A71